MQTPIGFASEDRKNLYQIVHLFQMFVTYVKHLSHGETQREIIVATVLYILKARASANLKVVPMEYLDKTYQAIADHVEKHKSHLIKPPTAALDYWTHKGRHARRKNCMDIKKCQKRSNDKKLCGEFEGLPEQTRD